MGNGNDLGRQLLEQNAEGTPPAGRDERLPKRVRHAKQTAWFLAALTVALWAAVALGAACYCWCFMTYIFPLLKLLATASPDTQAALSDVVWNELQLTGEATLVGTYLWAVLVVMAAVCTVLFILASRRATLRQIHGSLAELSDQLRAISEK